MSEPGVEEGKVAEAVQTAAAAGAGGASLRFARAARVVADAARAEGWLVPGFRSPPRLAGVERTVRRRADGGAVVAVRVRGRPWAAMAADLIEGVVVTNRLTGADAHRCRVRLWEALAPAEERAA
jgi:hypothetical protein